MTKSYCKPINDGAAVEYAPDFIVNDDGSVNHAPTAADYLAHGWFKNAIVAPSPQEGYIVKSTHYEAQGEEVVAVYEYEPIPVAPRKFSKLKIYGAIISLPDANGTSAWDKVKAWLEGKTINGVNGWMAFQLAQEISEDHPLFAVLADEARQLLGLTQEQFETLLNECILDN